MTLTVGNIEFATEYDNLILGTPRPCFMCGKITPWIEINFEGHLCSSECSEAIDLEIKAIYKKEREKWLT